MLERLVDREAWADRGDLEQDAARLAEVDRPEVEAVDDRRRVGAALGHALVPRLVSVLRGGPGDVVDGAGAGDAGFLRRLVVRVPGAALRAADLPHGIAVRVERERLLEKLSARARIRVRAHAVEALQGKLARYLRMSGDERLVVCLDDRELQCKSLRIGEAEVAFVALELDPLSGQTVVPELDRVLGGDAEDDPVHHPAAGSALGGVRVLEEREIAAGAALLVGVEEVVDGRVVLVDGLLDEAETEDAGVEVDVARRVRSDAGDVVDTLEAHVRSTLARRS